MNIEFYWCMTSIRRRARFTKEQGVMRELAETKQILDNHKKTLDKAKEIIMQHRSRSEENAHGALSKQAMDRNLRIANVANSVSSAAVLSG